MRGVVFLGEGNIEIREFPKPVPGPDEVIVRMKASGMCGSDLHHMHAPKRSESELVIEGHEPCGIVEEAGSAVRASEAKPGDRVMVHHYDGCRVCRFCRTGWAQFCVADASSKIVYGALNGNGAHAEYIKVAAHTLIRLPDELSFKAGAAISCGSGTAYGAIKRIRLSPDETVAVFGQGPVGLSCTMFAKAFGARVIAVEVGEERREMSKKMGADFVIDPVKDDPVQLIRDFTRYGEGADKSIECSSNPVARNQAIRSVKRWGATCMVGVNGSVEFNTDELIFEQKNVVGSWTFSKNLQEDCAHFVAERGIDVDSLFTHEFKLEDAAEAYRLFDQKKIGKGVFVF